MTRANISTHPLSADSRGLVSGFNTNESVCCISQHEQHCGRRHILLRESPTRRTEGPLESTIPGLSIRVITDRPRNTPNAGTPRSSVTGPHKGLDPRHAHQKINIVHTRRSERRLAVTFGRSSHENLLESSCQAHHVGYPTRLTMGTALELRPREAPR